MDAVNLPVLYVLLPLLLLSAALSLSDEPRNPEVVVLIGIRQSLNDPRGVLNNWDEYSVDPCSWAMITCSPENLVIGLGAPSQSLSGSLSAAIGNLTNLRQVLLQNNDISGKIPPELGTLPKLQTLDLSNNAFSGSVPHSLGLLDSLQYLRLNNNSLSGAIPASLARIPHLAFLDLSFNSFTPPVPEFAARTFNVAGNPRICGSSSSATEGCSGSNSPVSPSSPRPTAGKPSGAKIAAAMGTSLGVVCLLLLAVGFHLWQRKQQWQQYILNITDKEEEGLLRLGNLRVFTVRELQAATDHFSPKNLIGSGGFGDVYRGCLGDGTAVAVKRLKDLSGASGESQFRTELEMISLAVHRHLLRLIGYCVSPRERILVYPYMANGSVATRLRGRPALEWGERKRVAVGAARGLAYLHEQCDPKIIHRDVKAANVLLDGDCEAVVGDFGLAKLLDHGESHVTTAVRGTVGHIAPEYLSTGRSSEKTDVFGFGILLLELLSGMRTAPDAGKTASRNGAVLEQAKKVHRERKVEVLVDGELGGEYDRIEAGEMLQVAVLCTQNLPARRPRMSEVVRMLEGDGLAEKWAATHGEDDDFRIEPTGAAAGCDGGGVGDPPSGLGATMDGGEEVGEDEESLESFPMELSGPR